MRRMPRSNKIRPPFVPGIGGHDTVAGAVSDQVAANERVDNVRVVPLRRGADSGCAQRSRSSSCGRTAARCA